jgi:hypothetical protein
VTRSITLADAFGIRVEPEPSPVSTTSTPVTAATLARLLRYRRLARRFEGQPSGEVARRAAERAERQWLELHRMGGVAS